MIRHQRGKARRRAGTQTSATTQVKYPIKAAQIVARVSSIPMCIGCGGTLAKLFEIPKLKM